MYQQLKEMRTSQSVTDVFSGIDRNLRIADGFMSDMQNLTSDNYPMLSTRAPRVKVDTLVEANGLIAKEKLAWISNLLVLESQTMAGVCMKVAFLKEHPNLQRAALS